VSRENPILIAGHGRLPRVSLFGLLARWVGISLWGWARPESLPVPPLFEETAVGSTAATAARPKGRTARRGAAWVLLVVAAAIFAAGWMTRSQLSATHELLVTNPEHLSLLESAARLEQTAGRSVFLKLQPGATQQLRQGAERIRAGRESLLAAARVHARGTAALDSLGLAGRMLRGREVVAPLRRELERIDMPFLRGTLTFRELEEQSAPYGKAETPGRFSVRGTLVAAPPGHGLLIVPVGAGGEAGPMATVRQTGDSFELALEPEGTLRLTDVASRGGTIEVVEDRQVPVAAWNERGFGFPKSGSFFRVRLDAKSEAVAPPLARLSDAARDELAPLPPDLR
jgi:hypothetical protein